MKKKFSGSSDHLNEQPTVRCIDTERCETVESEIETDKTSMKESVISRIRVHSDNMIKQVSSSRGVLRIMPPATAVLVVLTVILHMTVGGGAALRPQEEITCVPDGGYQLAEYESQPYIDSDFNRNASELTIESTPDIETTIVETDEAVAQTVETTMSEQVVNETTEEIIVETTEETIPEPEFEAVDQTLYLAADRVNLRSEPNTSSEILDIVSLASKLHRTEVSDEWSLVTTIDGLSGYLMNKFLTEVKPEPTPVPTPTPTPVPAPEPVVSAPVQTSPGSAISADMQQQLVNKARSHLGQSYVWATSGPTTFDCSGFTSYMYRAMFGIEIPRTTSGQIVSGTGVSLSDIQIGDIICFDWKRDGACDHVGFYVGGGQYVHASYSRGKVVEGSIRSTDPIIAVRRIVY